MKTTTLIVLSAIIAAPTAHAQVSIEIAKITCQQYLAFAVADPRDLNIWLSGYFHGQRGTTVLEPQALKQNAEKLKAACLRKDNSDLPVLQVIEKEQGRGK